MPHTDPEARRAYYRAWKKKNPKRSSDKYYSAARHANMRAKKYGVVGILTTADVRSILADAACHFCGTTDAVIGLDHVVAMANGGPNKVENIVAACHSCNVRKRRGDSPEQWADEHKECVICGKTDRPHSGKGKCARCWHRLYSRQKRSGNRP